MLSKITSDSKYTKIDKKGNEIEEETMTTSIKKRPICSTRTGWHCCRPKVRQSDLKDYGMGMVIYFQFLKYMATLYCLSTIISIPSMIFYYSGSPATSLSLSEVVPSLSLGNIG